MSDILIRMEMPNNCCECSDKGLPVAISLLGAPCHWCHEIIDPKTNLRKARHTDCHLHELPEHGDLISLDDAKTVITRFLGYIDDDLVFRMKFMLGKDCPVIVPSNKEETK